MSKMGNLEYGVIAKIRLPMEMEAMGEVLKLFAKHYPGCVVPGSPNGANYFIIKEKDAENLPK